MSILVMSEVWAESPQKGGALLTLLAFADFANDDGLCHPRMATMARKTRLTERGVQKIISKLQSDGELRVFDGGFVSGKNMSNAYQVLTTRTKFTTPTTRTDGHPVGELRASPSGEPQDTTKNLEPSSEPSQQQAASGPDAVEGQLFSCDPPQEIKPPSSRGQKPDAVEPDVQKVWDHYARIFPESVGVGLTVKKATTIKKAIAAVNSEVDWCLRAIDGLKAFRASGKSRSDDTKLSVMFETGPHSQSNLTEQIEFWAKNASDAPTVIGALAGVMKDRANKVLLLIKQARDHPDDPTKRDKAQTELDWLRSKGYDVKIVNNTPTLVTKT